MFLFSSPPTDGSLFVTANVNLSQFAVLKGVICLSYK